MKEFALQAMLATALLVLKHAQAEPVKNTNGRSHPNYSTFAPLARPDSTEQPLEIYKCIGKVLMPPHHNSKRASTKAALGQGTYAQLIM